MEDCDKKHFSITKEKCLTCSEFLKCLMEEAKLLVNCPLLDKTAEKCNDYYTNNCYPNRLNICTKIFNTRKWKKEICKNYGEPKKEDDLKCALCNENTFNNCEICEIQLSNFTLSQEDASDSYYESIKSATLEPQTCFGSFAFEETCWNDCELKMSCLRRTKIVPNGKCTFFPKIESEDQILPEICRKCYFPEVCQKILTETASLIIKEQRMKKMFSGFFSIKELRNEFTIGE